MAYGIFILIGIAISIKLSRITKHDRMWMSETWIREHIYQYDEGKR